MSNLNDDRELWWWKPYFREMKPVIADYYEARDYNLNVHCESCGATWGARGGRSGHCPNCGSDCTDRLSNAWDDLNDPWMDDEYDAEDIEWNRITNYTKSGHRK